MAGLAFFPHLVVDDGARAIDFYVAAFGAVEVSRHRDGRDKIVHADLTLDGHTFTLADEYPEYDAFGPKARGGTSVVLTYKVQSGVDAAWQRAIDAGAEIVYPLVDQFYGARAGRLRDPFGHQWMMTMEIEQLSDDELQRRMAAWDAAQGGVDSI